MRNGLNIISSIKFRAALKHLDLIKEFFSSGLSEDRGGNPNTFKERTKISYRYTILKRKRKRRWAAHERVNYFGIFEAYTV